MSAINDVMTSAEVAYELGITQSHVRKLLFEKKINPEKYRKSGGITLFDKKYIQKLKKERGKKNK